MLKLLRDSGNEVLFQKLSLELSWNPAMLTDSIAAALQNGENSNDVAVLEQIQAMELALLLKVELSKI